MGFRLGTRHRHRSAAAARLLQTPPWEETRDCLFPHWVPLNVLQGYRRLAHDSKRIEGFLQLFGPSQKWLDSPHTAAVPRLDSAIGRLTGFLVWRSTTSPLLVLLLSRVLSHASHLQSLLALVLAASIACYIRCGCIDWSKPIYGASQVSGLV